MQLLASFNRPSGSGILFSMNTLYRAIRRLEGRSRSLYASIIKIRTIIVNRMETIAAKNQFRSTALTRFLAQSQRPLKASRDSNRAYIGFQPSVRNRKSIRGPYQIINFLYRDGFTSAARRMSFYFGHCLIFLFRTSRSRNILVRSCSEARL